MSSQKMQSRLTTYNLELEDELKVPRVEPGHMATHCKYVTERGLDGPANTKKKQNTNNNYSFN